MSSVATLLSQIAGDVATYPTAGQQVRTWSPADSEYGSNQPFYVSSLGSGAYLTIPPFATAVFSFATYNADAITPPPSITDSVTWTLISSTGLVGGVGGGSSLWVWAFKNQGSTAITVNPRVNETFPTSNNHTADLRGVILTGAADPARVTWPAVATPARTTDLSASITPTNVGSRLIVAFAEHGNGVVPPIRAATTGSTYSPAASRDGASISINTNGERQTAGFYWRTADETTAGSPVTVGSTVALTSGDDAGVIGIEVPPESQEPITSWLANAATQTGSSAAAITYTVPAGVPAGSTAVFWGAGNAGEFDSSWKVGATVTSSRAGTAITDHVLGFPENNTTFWAKILTGVQSGDVISITPLYGGTSGINGAYFDGPLRVGPMPSSRRQRRGTSTVAVVAPPITVPAGTKVWALGLTRQNTAGVAFASASNSNGRTVTSRLSSYLGSTDPAVNTNLLEFTEPTTSTGTTTINDTQSSGNGVGMHWFSPGTQAKVAPTTPRLSFTSGQKASGFLGTTPASITTNPFSPQAGDWVFVKVEATQSFNGAWNAPTITDSLGTHLAWSLIGTSTGVIGSSNPADPNIVYVFAALCPTAQLNMTATATLSVVDTSQYVTSIATTVEGYSYAGGYGAVATTEQNTAALALPITPQKAGSVISWATSKSTTATATAPVASGETIVKSTASQVYSDGWLGRVDVPTNGASTSARTVNLSSADAANGWQALAFEVVPPGSAPVQSPNFFPFF